MMASDWPPSESLHQFAKHDLRLSLEEDHHRSINRFARTHLRQCQTDLDVVPALPDMRLLRSGINGQKGENGRDRECFPDPPLRRKRFAFCYCALVHGG